MGTTLYQARQMDWIGIHYQAPITHIFSSTYPNGYNRAQAKLQPTITYSALLPTSIVRGENCVVCLEDNPDSYYCSNKHRYCKECLTDLFVSKVKALALCLLDSSRFGVTFHFSKPQHAYSYNYTGASYTFHYKEEEIPRCPICRESPGHSSLSFKQGKAVILNEDTNAKSPFWARCFLIYSIAHLAITAAQFIDPIRTPILYRVQRYAAPLDALILGSFFLSEAKMFQMEPEKNRIIWITTGLALALLPSFAKYRWTSTKTDLTPLLKPFLPKTALNQLQITNTPPWTHILLEVNNCAKFLIPLLATYFSTNRKVLLLASLINVLNFAKIVQAPWICFQRTFNVRFSRYAQTSTFKFYLMIPSPHKFFKEENPLTGALQSIYHSTTNFFENSTWNAIQYTGSRTDLVYSSTILPQKWLHQEIDLFQYVFEWGGTAYSYWNGEGSLAIKIKS